MTPRPFSPDAPAGHPDGDAVYAAPTRNHTDPYYAGLGGVAAPAAQLALYPQQTGLTVVGSGGMAWHAVEIDKVGEIVTWSVDGLLISSVDSTGLALGGDNIFFGHSDTNATSSTDPFDSDLLFTLIDNIRVDGEEAASVPEPATLLTLGTGLAGLIALRRKFSR